MNIRLTVTAAVAVILASVSVYPLIQTAGWFWAGVGAVITAAIAGIITRLPTLHAAVGSSVIALIAIGSLLASPSWGLKVIGVVVVAITALSRPRLRALRVLSCLITYLAALLIYLNVVFAARLSAAVVVPTRASLSYLSSLVSQGMGERIYAPPVPSTPGIILLAAGGIGLMAAATDLLAVRLRSPAIAGLPLLALYCVRITTSAKQGGVGATIVFSLGMIGYLALLAADGRERLRIWGRLVTVWHGSTADQAEAPDTRALAASGRRIGLAAACIALAFPLLVPGISVHDLFKTQPTGNGLGGTLITPPNPLDQMRGQLLSSSPQKVLTYQTNARDPKEQYLQVYALNYDPDSQAWSLIVPQPTASTQVGGGSLRVAPGVTARTPQTETTTNIKLSLGTTGYDYNKLGFLPVPYAPAQMQVPGSWEEDNTTLMVYSTQPQLSGLSYTVKSEEVTPDASEEDQSAAYPASISSGYLGFPAGPGRQLAKLAAKLTAGARTPYQKALDLQSYFLSGKFTYSVNVNLKPGINGLIEFLDTTRSGFCQQFAFAMAGLARLAGIPSRVAIGYTAGAREGRSATWQVTSADAHAWPELYFKGLGWVRFEPTPGGATGQGTAEVPQYAPAPNAAGVAPVPLATGQAPGSKAGHGNLNHIHGLGANGTGAGTSSTPRRHGGISPIPLILAGLFVLVLITPLTVRWLTRRYRLQSLRADRPPPVASRQEGHGPGPVLVAGQAEPAGPPARAGPPIGGDPARLVSRWRSGSSAGDAALAHAAWRELRDDLADYGHPCQVSESPRAVGRRVTAELALDTEGRQALGRIVSAEERARYATVPLAAQTLPADAAEIRRALYRSADWKTRWRARLLPASTITLMWSGLQHALDVFGWMDAAGLRLRGTIRRQE
jgi:transglutaminase-like putative cysteine protease